MGRAGGVNTSLYLNTRPDSRTLAYLTTNPYSNRLTLAQLRPTIPHVSIQDRRTWYPVRPHKYNNCGIPLPVSP